DGTLATGGLDGSITLGERRLLGHADAVTSLAFSPGGQVLASGGEDGGLRLWSLPEAGCQEFRHPAGIAALAFSSDGALLAVADGDSGITVYEVAGCGRRGGFQGPELGVESLHFKPGGHQLLALYDEGSARFWDCDSL
ncbi:MAG: hypothetical protein KC910_34905, partial [Candidatus Eremiobacteraeota bacterium]|nr:hypothetical protein [Candidatus Eremiobacteraeota bacterium]